ncbi:MAG: DUF2723 domain-containing protein [Mucilaginibacter polytrichastri]|nr:DUF2723 domain-containing protein [Mucilaginibacter polytrichastri]
MNTSFTRFNTIFGWACFGVALVTYTLTLERTVSFWDCGEFIACAYRLQVAHQPGAPLFSMIGKVFSLLSFGDNTQVAFWVNMSSAIASAATILFLFWTITALAKKLVVKKGDEISSGQLIAIMAAGVIGALAYTFSDTFWFSAVEAEVYALSSLCTAIVFWGILKWEAHADDYRADKWLVFIAYVMGLSIGIHLLNLLVIPAIAVVYYFRRSKTVTSKGTIWALVVGCVALLFVQFGIIQYTVKGAAYFDLFFVNTLGMGFGSGVLVFLLLIIGLIVWGIHYSIRQHNYVLNIALICFAFILFGYSSFISLPIRAKADPNLNNTDVDNAFALNSYLNREQYPSAPLAYGQFFDSKVIAQDQGMTFYRKGKEKYEPSGTKQKYEYDRNTLLPRMFSSDQNHVQFYRDWMRLGEGQKPTFSTNLGFLFSWQINQMYTRYFLWNFAGRYNDMDGQNNQGLDGGWTAGFTSKKELPKTISESTAYNRLYFLPLILGLLGAVYHFRKDQKYAGVVGLLFFFTGIAIVLYLNQDPLQPRERDYAYAGSFYAFAIWIGLGVLAIADLPKHPLGQKNAAMLSGAVCLLAVPALMASQEWDDHDRSEKRVAHDMAVNYLQSCKPNAILFTNADNDTFPLWYAQEVENIRPDVRVVILTLAQMDWSIRQMKQRMNSSAPLPLTMENEQFAGGTRDVLPFSDAGIKGDVPVKDVLGFMLSEDAQAKVEYEDGSTSNYLPTRNLSLKINPDEVIRNGIVSAGQRSRIDTVMRWTFPGNYITKDGLAILDILAHNHWKRPVYFAVTAGRSVFGLENYLYNEGFAYELMPLKQDSSAEAFSKTNSPVMYENVMNRFRWGNMKHARYLDPLSTTFFMPVMLNQMNTLAENLISEGRPDLARNVVRKCDTELPDIYPDATVSLRKFYLADTCYRLRETAQANKLVTGVAAYLTDQLRYHAQTGHSMQAGGNDDIQFQLSLLAELVKMTENYKQPRLYAALSENLDNYSRQFGIRRQE